VFDVRAPWPDRVTPWAKSIIDSDVALENLAAPAVMIARDLQDVHSGIHDIGQGRHCSESSSRDDGSPFEPEFEQIPVDDERAPVRCNVTKKTHDRTFDVLSCEAEVRVGHDVARRWEHARILPEPRQLYKQERSDELGRVTHQSVVSVTEPLFHDVEFRVRYAETDQMGVVYHANYLVWCEVGRTDFIRARGMSYAEMERAGVGLAVSDMSARFHSAARYDDMIRVRTTVAEVRSRGITFDYLITKSSSGERLVSARTALVSIDRSGKLVALPSAVRAMFEPR
jgi:acyl-CoA thioester hydrolase